MSIQQLDSALARLSAAFTGDKVDAWKLKLKEEEKVDEKAATCAPSVCSAPDARGNRPCFRKRLRRVSIDVVRVHCAAAAVRREGFRWNLCRSSLHVVYVSVDFFF